MVSYSQTIHNRIDELSRQANESSIIDAISKHERILKIIGSHLQDTELGALDYTDAEYELARLKLVRAADYGDDDDHGTDPALPTEHRIQFCEEAIGHLTNCYSMRKEIFEARPNHKKVRDANYLKFKASLLLDQLKRLHSYEIWAARKHPYFHAAVA